MKAGTTSLHGYLDQNPQVSMSRPKELNFFLAEEDDPSAGSRPDWNFYRVVDSVVWPHLHGLVENHSMVST